MPEKKGETVILLHGILRSKMDMYPITKYLEGKGYDTLNILYPSRQQSLEELTNFIHEKIQTTDHCLENKELHFVTHSMGSLIARYYITIHKPENLGKVVMLGPPNTGSEFADFLSETKIIAPLFKHIYGPAGQQLRTDYTHIDKDITYPLGVIAGNMSINPLAPWVLPGEHDGIVPVERTKIEGMTDHIVVQATHSFMMFNPKVMGQIHHFLEYNKFKTIDQN
ncbi:MAG: alpha/beta hydrolase [Alphaproteobacteria bacterium]|nr:alpha/beta hydrolase [Alphaproteobacteria bacterium]